MKGTRVVWVIMAALVSLFFLGACVQPPTSTAIQATIETTWDFVPILNVSEHQLQLTADNKRVTRYDLQLDVGKVYPSEIAATQGIAAETILRDARASLLTVIAKDTSGRELGRRSFALQSHEADISEASERSLVKPAGVYLYHKTEFRWEVYTLAYINHATNPAPVDQIWNKLQNTTTYNGYMLRRSEPELWWEWVPFRDSKGKAAGNTSGFWTTLIPASPAPTVKDMQSGNNFNPHTGQAVSGNPTIQSIRFASSSVIEVTISNPGDYTFASHNFSVFVNDPPARNVNVQKVTASLYRLTLATDPKLQKDDVVEVIGLTTLQGTAEATYTTSLEEMEAAFMEAYENDDQIAMHEALTGILAYYGYNSSGERQQNSTTPFVERVWFTVHLIRNFGNYATYPEIYEDAARFHELFLNELNSNTLVAASMKAVLEKVDTMLGGFGESPLSGGHLTGGVYDFSKASYLWETYHAYQYAFRDVTIDKAHRILNHRDKFFPVNVVGFNTLQQVGFHMPDGTIANQGYLYEGIMVNAIAPVWPYKGKIFVKNAAGITTQFDVEQDYLARYLADPVVGPVLKPGPAYPGLTIQVAIDVTGTLVHRLVRIELPEGQWQWPLTHIRDLTSNPINLEVPIPNVWLCGGGGPQQGELTPSGKTTFIADGTAPYITFGPIAQGWTFSNLEFLGDPAGGADTILINSHLSVLRDCDFNPHPTSAAEVSIDLFSDADEFNFINIKYNNPTTPLIIPAVPGAPLPGNTMMRGATIIGSVITNLETQIPDPRVQTNLGARVLERDALTVIDSEILGTVEANGEGVGTGIPPQQAEVRWTKFIRTTFSNPVGVLLPAGAGGEFVDTLFDGCHFAGPVTFPIGFGASAFGQQQNFTFKGNTFAKDIILVDSGPGLVFGPGNIFQEDIWAGVPGGGLGSPDGFIMQESEIWGSIDGSVAGVNGGTTGGGVFGAPLTFIDVTFNHPIATKHLIEDIDVEIDGARFIGTGMATFQVDSALLPCNLILKGPITGQIWPRPIFLTTNTDALETEMLLAVSARPLHLKNLVLRPWGYLARTWPNTYFETGVGEKSLVMDYIRIENRVSEFVTFNTPNAVYNDIEVRQQVYVDARNNQGRGAIFTQTKGTTVYPIAPRGFNTEIPTAIKTSLDTWLLGTTNMDTRLEFHGVEFHSIVTAQPGFPVRDVLFNGAIFHWDQSGNQGVAGPMIPPAFPFSPFPFPAPDDTFGDQYGSSRFIGNTEFRHHVVFNNQKLILGLSGGTGNGVVFRNRIPIGGSNVMVQNILCAELETAIRNAQFVPQNNRIEFWCIQGDLIISKADVGNQNLVEFLILPDAANVNRLFFESDIINNGGNANFPLQNNTRIYFGGLYTPPPVLNVGRVLAKRIDPGSGVVNTTFFRGDWIDEGSGNTYYWPTNVERIQ